MNKHSFMYSIILAMFLLKTYAVFADKKSSRKVRPPKSYHCTLTSEQEESSIPLQLNPGQAVAHTWKQKNKFFRLTVKPLKAKSTPSVQVMLFYLPDPKKIEGTETLVNRPHRWTSANEPARFCGQFSEDVNKEHLVNLSCQFVISQSDSPEETTAGTQNTVAVNK